MTVAQQQFMAGRLVQVEFRNVRGFHHLRLSFVGGHSGQPRPAKVLIGRNGTGKTTLLRALAIALSDQSTAQALLAQPTSGLITSGKREALIRIAVLPEGAREPETIEATLFDSGGNVRVTWEGWQPASPWFVSAYGAGRGIIGTGRGDSGALFNLVSLFDYRSELLDAELTLRRLQDYLGDANYTTLRAACKRILGLGDEDDIVLPKGGGVEIVGPGVDGRVPLVAWADGYRLTLHWLLDLFGRALQAGMINTDGHVTGMVLIDELEQHLHPALQAAMVPRLVEQLPHTQFVVTTHSPLVALGAQPDDLVPLRRVGERVVAETDVPDYRGFSAEDMLADDRLFDSSVYAPEAQKQLDRFEELVQLDPDTRSREATAELRQLARDMLAEPLPSHLTQAFEDTLRKANRPRTKDPRA